MTLLALRDAKTQSAQIRRATPHAFRLCAASRACLRSPAIVRIAEPVSFKRDIAPVLLNNCLACHGPKKAEGGYRIDTFERVTAAGDSTQPGFMAKDLDGSEAFRRITSTDVKERMPLEGDPLPAEQVALLKQWIEAGVPFDGPDAKAAAGLVHSAAHASRRARNVPRHDADHRRRVQPRRLAAPRRRLSRGHRLEPGRRQAHPPHPEHRPADLCHPLTARMASFWPSPAALPASTAKCGCSKPTAASW